MAQHDYVIDNQASAAARSDLNNLFQAIVTQNSGDTAPATTYANMIWYETDTNTLWKRNEANSGWISMGTFDESALTFTPSGTPSIATQAEAEAGSNNTKMMTPLRTSQAITALGGGMVLLGTINTTSGTTQTLSSLTLTNYRNLFLELNGVAVSGISGGGGNFALRFDSSTGSTFSPSSSTAKTGFALINLVNGAFFAHVTLPSSSTTGSGTFPSTTVTGQAPYFGRCALTTASTSVTIAYDNTTGGFSAGTVKVWGMK